MSVVSHIKEHAQLGIPEAHAVVQAYPSTPATYFSPIAGDPDAATNVSISEIFHIGTGFLLPKAGVLTDIAMKTQGSSGTGDKNVRVTVATIKRDNTSFTGLAVDQILYEDVVVVDGAFNGVVTLATGLTLSVPAQFMVFVKAPFGAGISLQAMNGAGPIPGVVGMNNAGNLIAACSYIGANFDSQGVTPASMTPGEKISAHTYKGVGVFIKWRGQ